jgi:hypothetical protein
MTSNNNSNNVINDKNKPNPMVQKYWLELNKNGIKH